MLLMATCCPGLEFVLAGEIGEKLRAAARTERGKAFFDAPVGAAMALRCADNLYAFVGEARVGPHRADLPRLADALRALPVRDVVARLGEWGVSGEVVHVSASRSGKHSYSRFEAAAAALPALCGALGARQGDETDCTCALRLDVEGGRARLYVKLTPPEFRFRGARDFSPAALRPTIAHALVRLTEPRDGDVFCDPFCGSGTLLAERATMPAAHIVGGDVDGAVAAVARQNAPGCDVRVWDASRLPLADASVDAVATNPPWGKQIATDGDGLYRAFPAELRRVCKRDARIVVLTDREEALRDGCASVGYGMERLATISLHGTLAGVFRLS